MATGNGITGRCRKTIYNPLELTVLTDQRMQAYHACHA
jgi:hypothetical protein